MGSKWLVYKIKSKWIAHKLLGLYYEFDSWEEAYMFAYIGNPKLWEHIINRVA